MRRTTLFAAGSAVATALALAGIVTPPKPAKAQDQAATGQAPAPAAAEAVRVEAEAYRKDTLAERYRLTAEALRSRDLAEELIDEALDGDTVLDGDHLLDAALTPDRSDLPGIRERGFLRLAVAPDPLLIAYDGERAIGVAMELARELEKHLRASRGTGTPTVVVPMPTPRRAIVERVNDGAADFAALTINVIRDEHLDFTVPLLENVNDIVILGDEASDVSDIEDLTDTPIYVQEGGRYAANLLRLNEVRADEGRAPLKVRFVDERLDDYDLMELVEIGLIPATVMADYKAAFWSQIYDGVEVRSDLELTRDSRIAWGVRSSNPALLKALDGFANKVKKGTLIGNVVLRRYLGSTEWIENINNDRSRTLIAEVEPTIRKYSDMFEFEADLVLAQAYQESQLDQSKRSHVGAIGVMQVMPTTAADPVVGIPDVTGLDDNVHAGIKYLRWLRDTYFDDDAIEPLDQTLLAFAAYNAGPGGVQRAQAKAVEMGLDPDVWFENVELAITRAVSREPAVYVRNIFKYYVSYRLMRELEENRDAAREAVAEITEEVEDLPIEDRIEALEDAEIVSDTDADPADAEAEPQLGMNRDALADEDGTEALADEAYEEATGEPSEHEADPEAESSAAGEATSDDDGDESAAAEADEVRADAVTGDTPKAR